jgi:hypothetical protein
MPEFLMILASGIRIPWKILGNQSSLEIHWVSPLMVLALWEVLLFPVLEFNNFLQFLRILNMVLKLRTDR